MIPSNEGICDISKGALWIKFKRDFVGDRAHYQGRLVTVSGILQDKYDASPSYKKYGVHREDVLGPLKNAMLISESSVRCTS